MKLVLGLIMIFITCPFFGQAPDEQVAAELYSKGRYGQALQLYLKEIEHKPGNFTANYRVGICYLKSRSQKVRAVPYLEKALESAFSAPGNKFSAANDTIRQLYKDLGDAYRHSFRFSEALACYERSAGGLKTDGTHKSEDDLCGQGLDIFSAFELPESRQKDPQFWDRIYFGDSGKLISEETGKILHTSGSKKEADKNHEKRKDLTDTVITISTVGASADGKIILTYRNDHGEGNLYLSYLNANHWSKPAKLGRKLNNAGWEPMEIISADDKAMYFVSSRDGGYGGRDIYRCLKGANGSWEKAVNLGPGINTAADEEAPYILPDGQTLYFSSDRDSKGQFDVYSTEYKEDQWTQPLSVGYPIDNDPANEFYQVNRNGQVTVPAELQGSLANKGNTRNAGNKSATTPKAPVHENAMLTFNNSAGNAFSLINGKVTDHNGKVLKVRLEVTVLEKSGEPSVFYNDSSGGYALLVNDDSEIPVYFDSPGYLFQSVRLVKDSQGVTMKRFPQVMMPPVEKGAQSILHNILFLEGSDTLAEGYEETIERIRRCMKAYPDITLQVGLTFKAGNREQKKLWQMRALRLKSEIVSGGIPEDRVQVLKKRVKPDPLSKNTGDKKQPENENKLIVQIDRD